MSTLSVRAARRVAAAPDTVFAFLADLENHWALTADWVQVQRWGRPTTAPPAAPACGCSGRSACPGPRGHAG